MNHFICLFFCTDSAKTARYKHSHYNQRIFFQFNKLSDNNELNKTKHIFTQFSKVPSSSRWHISGTICHHRRWWWRRRRRRRVRRNGCCRSCWWWGRFGGGFGRTDVPSLHPTGRCPQRFRLGLGGQLDELLERLRQVAVQDFVVAKVPVQEVDPLVRLDHLLELVVLGEGKRGV